MQMPYWKTSSDSRVPLSTAIHDYIERSSGVYSNSGEYCGEMVNLAELKTMSNYREVKFREFFDQCVDKVHSTTQPNKLQWICKEAHNCPEEACFHNQPHEWDEDCRGEIQCTRGFIVDSCCRVDGPKHKQITEGRCKDLWED